MCFTKKNCRPKIADGDGKMALADGVLVMRHGNGGSHAGRAVRAVVCIVGALAACVAISRVTSGSVQRSAMLGGAILMF